MARSPVRERVASQSTNQTVLRQVSSPRRSRGESQRSRADL